MKIKRSLNNLLILVSPGGTSTVCTGDKFLKIRVPTQYFLLQFITKPNQLFSLNIRKIIALKCIIDASTKAVLGAVHKVCTHNLSKK